MTGVREPEHAQHIGDGHDKGRPFAEMMDAGLLWLINTSVFHPRGVALSIHVDRETGAASGWSLVAAEPGEVMRYAVPAELADPSAAPDVDAAYRAAEATLAAARGAS